MKYTFYMALLCLGLASCKTNEQVTESAKVDSSYYHEAHRPQFHFSPKEKWMNDPNGLVYLKGDYHLFYQYYPNGMTWGPMHWGHAISKDLFHWEHLPIALYPDSLGLIFSGSAVVDAKNSSGFGSETEPPLVAIFTYHSVEKEKAGKTDYQNQGIAFSTDNGRTWSKYANNPVLKNQGIKDFRDPKVFYHEQSKRWVMILAVKDHTELWSSEDLKKWNKLSEFGLEYGGHGGVWECPDLFELPIEGSSEKRWVMLVSINPGGPNGGSATQYFVGDFDGKSFKTNANKNDSIWIDYGPDNYAGVTYANVENRKIFLGWMSNWFYGEAVPTQPWRSANTIPRDLSLVKIEEQLFVKSKPSAELETIISASKTMENQTVKDSVIFLSDKFNPAQSRVSATLDAKDFAFILSNSLGEKVKIGFEKEKNRFYIDRGKSGKTAFSEKFNAFSYAPRFVNADKINITLVFDVSSVEVFFDDGVTVMTSLFFPNEEFSRLSLQATEPLTMTNIKLSELKSVWSKQ